MRAAPSQEEVRRQNLGALLRYVHRHGPTSRAELTARLRLNRSTIGALTTDLTAAGLVHEEAPEAGRAGRAGRPSLVVSPRSELVCAYAVAVETDRVSVARVGLGGVLLGRRAVARDPDQGPPELAKVVATAVRELDAAAPAQVRRVGTGVAVTAAPPGGGGGRGRAPPPPPPPRAARAAAGAGGPLAFGSTADLAALAEQVRGVAAGCDHVIYLSGEVGVTAGMITGGRPLRAPTGRVGEVGHMVVNPAGRRCRCGSRGCWETEVGQPALLRAAGRTGVAGRDAIRAVMDAAARGDVVARAAVRQVGDWLGLGVGNLVNIFHPQMIIFGGHLRDVYLVAAARLRSRLNMVALAESRNTVRLRTPSLGDDAPLIGAAELAFEALVEDPLAPA